jgi:hypothetical protein
MSEDKYFDQLSKCLEDTGLSEVAPNLEALKEALSIDGTKLGTLTSQKISSLIFTLSRYQLYLQLQCNIRSVKRNTAKRQFEIEQGKALIKLPSSKLTVKEKAAKVLEEHEGLANLESKYATADDECTLFHKTPEMVLEIINALKKELSIRSGSN